MGYNVCFKDQDVGDTVFDDFDQVWGRITEICQNASQIYSGGDLIYEPNIEKNDLCVAVQNGDTIKVDMKYMDYDDELCHMPLCWVSLTNQSQISRLRKFFNDANENDKTFLGCAFQSTSRALLRSIRTSDTYKELMDMIPEVIPLSEVEGFINHNMEEFKSSFDFHAVAALLVAIVDHPYLEEDYKNEYIDDLASHNEDCNFRMLIALSRILKTEKSFKTLPKRWECILDKYIRDNFSKGRKRLELWFSDFYTGPQGTTPKTVKIYKESSGMELNFTAAFAIIDQEHSEVAVFTDTDGYFIFPYFPGQTKVEDNAKSHSSP